MKSFQQRIPGAYPYYRLAVWDGRYHKWRERRADYPSAEFARQVAVKPGKYRISEVTEAGRRDLEPFDVV